MTRPTPPQSDKIVRPKPPVVQQEPPRQMIRRNRRDSTGRKSICAKRAVRIDAEREAGRDRAPQIRRPAVVVASPVDRHGQVVGNSRGSCTCVSYAVWNELASRWGARCGGGRRGKHRSWTGDIDVMKTQKNCGRVG